MNEDNLPSAVQHNPDSGGVLEVLRIALPLVMSSIGHSVNLFMDRAMLSHYSLDAMAASFLAGLWAFTFSCFFIGAGGYANAFVAQYVGAKNPHRVGPAVWQGIFMSLIGGGLLAFGAIFSKQFFDWTGHAEELRPLEVTYFNILMYGTVISLLNVAFSAFWGGRGKTKMIMIVNLIVMFCNVPFNYLLIYGRSFEIPGLGTFAVPEMGIAGAAYGTLLAGFVGNLIFAYFFFRRESREEFHTCRNILDWSLFKRLVRFGGPNGIQFCLDLLAFSLFITILGEIDKTVLAASGITFAVNNIAFTPMYGIGQTVSILVGQSIGAKNIPHAERSVKSARTVIICYMTCVILVLAFYPDPILTHVFKLEAGSVVMEMTRTMLRFIAAYLFFDAMFILYGSAIKGAGDTKFAMYMGAGMAWFLFAIPCYIAYRFFHASVWVLWYICVIYVIICGTIFYFRYRSGKWKTMQVIEAEANDHPLGAIPKEPGVEPFLP